MGTQDLKVGQRLRALHKRGVIFLATVGLLPALTERFGRGRWPASLEEIAVSAGVGIAVVLLGSLLIRGVARDLQALRRKLRELERLALTDALTGAGNVRALHRRLREAREGWIITADLDRLKAVNDEQGHLAGDRLIARATETLRSAVGTTGMVFRTGGDEFVLLLPGAGERETLACAQAVLHSMSADIDRASFSLGLAPLTDDPWAAVARADEAMYHAKRTGGGRLVVARP